MRLSAASEPLSVRPSQLSSRPLHSSAAGATSCTQVSFDGPVPPTPPLQVFVPAMRVPTFGAPHAPPVSVSLSSAAKSQSSSTPLQVSGGNAQDTVSQSWPAPLVLVIECTGQW